MDVREFAYDVGLSFAGEQREYVEDIADALRLRGIRVFLDKYEKAALWGKKGRVLGEWYMFELNWADFSSLNEYPEMLVAHEMVMGATENYCEEHGAEFLDRLDFSQLARATATVETHEIEA